MTTSYVDQLQNRITQIDERIAKFNSEISTLEGESNFGSTEIEECFTQEINKLKSIRDNLVSRKTKIEARISTITSDWTTEQKTIVDSISTLFNAEFDETINSSLKFMNDTRKNSFFKMYQDANSDVQRRWVIKATFGV